MNTPVKLAIGIGSLSGIAGGAYSLSQHLSKETISQKLEKNKYKIFEDYSNEEWERILQEYKLIAEGDNNKFKFEGSTITTKEELHAQCKVVLSKIDTEEDIYNRAAKWCTVPKTLKEVLGDRNYVAIDTDDQKDNETEGKWNPKIKLHNDKTKNTDKRFSKLGGESDEVVKEDSGGRGKIRKACKDLEEKKHYEKDFESDLDKSILWCTETKSQNN